MPARDWLAGRPSSRASQLLQFERRVPARDWLAGRPPSPASQLLQGLSTSERDWAAGRPPSPASQLLQGLSTSERDWAAGRPLSLASQLLQLGRVCLRGTGWLAGRLREQARSHSLSGVYLRGIGWLAGRHRWQASAYSLAGHVCKKLVGRQAVFASKPAPTKEQRQSGVHPRPSPLIRPSVSSPAALDLDPPAPSEG